MIIKDKEKYRKIIEFNDISPLLTTKDICDKLEVTRRYFDIELRSSINRIETNREVMALVEEELNNFEDKTKAQKSLLKIAVDRKRMLYTEKHVAAMIKNKFLLEGQEMTETEALFLVQFDWCSAKKIKEKKDHEHTMQTYRYLTGNQSPYLKITTKNGEKSSLVRYVRVG